MKKYILINLFVVSILFLGCKKQEFEPLPRLEGFEGRLDNFVWVKNDNLEQTLTSYYINQQNVTVNLRNYLKHFELPKGCLRLISKTNKLWAIGETEIRKYRRDYLELTKTIAVKSKIVSVCEIDSVSLLLIDENGAFFDFSLKDEVCIDLSFKLQPNQTFRFNSNYYFIQDSSTITSYDRRFNIRKTLVLPKAPSGFTVLNNTLVLLYNSKTTLENPTIDLYNLNLNFIKSNKLTVYSVGGDNVFSLPYDVNTVFYYTDYILVSFNINTGASSTYTSYASFVNGTNYRRVMQESYLSDFVLEYNLGVGSNSVSFYIRSTGKSVKLSNIGGRKGVLYGQM